MTFATSYRLLSAALLLAASPALAAWETPGQPTTTVAEQQAEPAPGITATVREPFYHVTSSDIGNAIAEQLHAQGVENKAEVTLNPGTPSVMYTADHPIKLVIHTLQVDTTARRWQAQAYFVGNGKTETVKPISGVYGAMIDVPVLTRQFTKTDVIAESDLEIRAIPERLLRKDTITDTKQLVGLSPRNGISPGRPIHANEITPPILIKKGEYVEMTYNTPYIHIKTTGVALEDGAKGGSIRVKNQKSERAVSAKVVAAGRVEVAGDTTL